MRGELDLHYVNVLEFMEGKRLLEEVSITTPGLMYDYTCECEYTHTLLHRHTHACMHAHGNDSYVQTLLIHKELPCSPSSLPLAYGWSPMT